MFKKIARALGKAFKGFFVSLWEDFVDALKHHWIGLLGRVVMILVPLVFTVSMYIHRVPSKWALPTFAWIPLFVFTVVYWSKLRTYLAIKISAMQVENNIQKGKHAGAIIVAKTLQIGMTVFPFFMCYRIFAAIEAEAMSVKNVFFFITMCEAIGGLLVLIDTVANVIDYSEGENK